MIKYITFISIIFISGCTPKYLFQNLNENDAIAIETKFFKKNRLIEIENINNRYKIIYSNVVSSKNDCSIETDTLFYLSPKELYKFQNIIDTIQSNNLKPNNNVNYSIIHNETYVNIQRLNKVKNKTKVLYKKRITGGEVDINKLLLKNNLPQFK